jgi:hypothetical protein
MVKKKAHKKPRRMWMLVPEKKPKPKVPEATKQRVSVQTLLPFGRVPWDTEG